MNRFLNSFVLVAGIFAMAAAPALAQTSPPATQPPTPTAPTTRGRESVPKEKQIEGSVQSVDPTAKTIEVGGLLGRTTLQVTGNTLIHSLGQAASPADIQQGTKVKASYEPRDGQNIATSIEILPTVASLAQETLGEWTGR